MMRASEIVPTKKFEAITSALSPAVNFLTNTHSPHLKDSQPKWLTRSTRVRSVSILVSNLTGYFYLELRIYLFCLANIIVQARHILALPTMKEATWRLSPMSRAVSQLPHSYPSPIRNV